MSVPKLAQRLENEKIILYPTLRVGIKFCPCPGKHQIVYKLHSDHNLSSKTEVNPINRLVYVVSLLVYVEKCHIKIKEKPQNVGTSVRPSVPKCCVTCNSKGALDRVNKLYRIVDQHMKLVLRGLVSFQSFCSWLSKKIAIFNVDSNMSLLIDL
jgi:hypothetical protein